MGFAINLEPYNNTAQGGNPGFSSSLREGIYAWILQTPRCHSLERGNLT
ncbi:hypothetical protein [Rickettsia endosymbiont of Aspidapion aeneum]